MEAIKNLILLICISLIGMNLSGQSANPEFDEALARKYGADEYGMKSYVLVILKSGSVTIENSQERDSLFSGHLKNIRRLADEGHLVVAGPLGSNDKSYRGIFIINVVTLEEAAELLKTDPAVMAKIFDTELYEWYGSAELGEYLKVHNRIAKVLF